VLRTGRFRIRIPEEVRNFPPFQKSVRAMYRMFLPGSRQRCPRSEANHLPPSSAEVKNHWIRISNPPTFLHIVHRNNYTFNFDQHCSLWRLLGRGVRLTTQLELMPKNT